VRYLKIFLLAAILPVLTAEAQAPAMGYTESFSCSAYSSIVGQPGTVLLPTVSGCDDCTELVTLPFTFNWYGDTPITQVQVSSNGQININAGDTDNNCCSADPVVVAGAYTQPRIAVAQEDLYPPTGGGIYALDTGSSFIIEYDNIPFYFDVGNVQAQVELFPNGDIQIRWGQVLSDGSSIAVGVEDDTRIPQDAVPATGAPFVGDGIANNPNMPQDQCRSFTAAALALGAIPTLNEWGVVILSILIAIAATFVLRRRIF
jgi:hypothetical protein